MKNSEKRYIVPNLPDGGCLIFETRRDFGEREWLKWEETVTKHFPLN